MSNTVTPRWLTLGNKGTAKLYCSISDRQLKREIRAGRIKSHFAGGRRLIDRESLDAWIEGKPAQGEP